MSEQTELLILAEMHAARLHEDIGLATTRQEHIRVTARANEAAEIVNSLKTASANTVSNN
jgi:hypothetical protein